MSTKKNTKNTAKKTAKAAPVPKDNSKAIAAAEKAKHGQMIAAASAEGFALSKTYEQHTVDTLSLMLGKKFEVSLGGASIKEKVSEAEAAKAVVTLAEVTERNDTVRSTTMLALGGVVIGIKEQFGDDAGNKLIQQAVSSFGKSKHTVQEAERVVRWRDKVFKTDPEAVAGLTYTHLQELKNGSQDAKGKPTVEPAKLRSIVKKVQEGKVISSGKTSAGKPFEQRKILSCAETRELLVEAGGGNKKKTKKASGKAAVEEVDPDKHKFLYIDNEGENAFSIGWNKAMADKCKDGLVFDLTDMTELRPSTGAIYRSIKECPAEKAPEPAEKAPEPAKEDKTKADKPKADKKSKASIPD